MASPQTDGVAFTGTNTLTAEDAYGNTVTSFNAATNNVTITSNGSLSSGTVSGLGSSGNNVLDQAGDFSSGVADLTGKMIYTGKTGTGTFTASAATGGASGTSGNVTINVGAASQVLVETAADGSGTVVPAQNVTSGNTVTGYAISRDAGGNFIANVAADSWSLASKTGGVADGDLVAAGDNKSATFTGNLVGSAQIHVTSGALTPVNSGTLTVVHGTATQVRVETAADGSGTVVPAQNIASGSGLIVYSITRDAAGNYVANAAVTWSLINKTDGVVNGDLVANANNRNATFTGHVIGTAKIHVSSAGLTSVDSGVLTVVAGTATTVQVETAADGSGTVVPAQNVTSGNTVTGYAITRDASGNFVANAAATWSLTSKTGGVVNGDLVAAGDNKSATFTGALTGSAKMHAAITGLTSVDSGVLTVVKGTATKVQVETAADGSGTVVPSQNVTSGSSLTVYAISRDVGGNFIANVAADMGTGWTLTNITGGVVSGDLSPAGNRKSATFAGNLVGTAIIHVTSGSLTAGDSGTLTVVAGPASAVTLSGPTSVVSGTVSGPYVLTTVDQNGNQSNVVSNTVFNLASTGAGIFYSNSGGTAVITQRTIAAGQALATFYYRPKQSGSQTLSATRTSGDAVGSATLVITPHPRKRRPTGC